MVHDAQKEWTELSFTSHEADDGLDTKKKQGYAHKNYAASLAEFGQPRRLPRCDGTIIVRQIPGTTHHDAMGCYPLFDCQDWSGLPLDLDEIGRDLVTLTLVPAPFGKYDYSSLKACFDQVSHFKEHFIADLSRPVNEIIKSSHRATVRRALRKVDVRQVLRPQAYLEKWVELFSVLIKRHNIKGLRGFSKRAFAKQLAVPGLVMFEALAEGGTVGLDLWYVQGDVAYGHLTAFSELGYKLRASYATKWYLLNYFAGKVRWVDFGGGTGSQQNGNDGLTKFKQGWSTGTRPVYVCGKVFSPKTYHQLSIERDSVETKYFPAYRKGEF